MAMTDAVGEVENMWKSVLIAVRHGALSWDDAAATIVVEAPGAN
jgi:hypothetical protein